jgi:hypothetical protein
VHCHRNVRLGCKWLTVTISQAYYGTELIAATRHFIVYSPPRSSKWNEQKFCFHLMVNALTSMDLLAGEKKL